MSSAAPRKRSFVTDAEKERMIQLRVQGRSYREIGEILGRRENTVRSHLVNGSVTKVPNAPLREAFLASSFSATDVAAELGWFHIRKESGSTRLYTDSARVKRALGILADSSVKCGRRYRTYRAMVDVETIERIAYAIGVMPWEVMPDDDDTGG